VQWWEFKSTNFDSVLLFKMGKFYELFEMDAHVAVEALGLSYMKVNRSVLLIVYSVMGVRWGELMGEGLALLSGRGLPWLPFGAAAATADAAR
jgi:hypothetical protein